MAKRGAKKTGKKTAKRRPAKRPAKKKAKKKAAKRPAKKRVTKKKTAKRTTKKKAAKKKAARKKPARKKTVRKKIKKKRKTASRSSASAIEARLERRIGQLTEQLDEVRSFAEKELKKQRKNFDELLVAAKHEQRELSAKLGQFIDDHDTWQEISQSVKNTAQELEARVKSAVSRITDRDDD